MCLCQTRIERIDAGNIADDPGFAVTKFAQQAEAIAIGPRSVIDRCYLVPLERLQSRANVGANTSTRDDFTADVIEVSAERPWIGTVTGPFAVWLPYGNDIHLTGNASLPWKSAFNGLFGPDVSAFPVTFLDLQFFMGAPPPWLPTKRAPLDHALLMRNFGTAGGQSSGIDVIPGWGRHRMTFSLRVSGITAGSLSYSIDGHQYASSGGETIDITKNLQPTTVVAADTNQSYRFDGEFDVYFINFSEEAALNAGVLFSWIVKGWD